MLGWFLLVLLSTQMAATSPSTQSLRLCGSQLADALDIVCGSNFYFRMSKAPEYTTTTPMPKLRRPFFKLKRYKRGVSSECCQSPKGCRIETLASYCFSPSPLYADALSWFIHRRNIPERRTLTTEEPVTSVPTSTTRPFDIHSRKKQYFSFFFVHTGPRPTRKPFR